jgi:DNA-binding NarL/FixJ family response regulator
MTNAEMARIGIVAADPLRRVGLEAILNEIPGLAAVPLSLEQAMASGSLAAIVLDARAAGPNLGDVLARFRREVPGVKVVVLGESLDPKHVQRVIGAGAKGYLAETVGEDEIRMAMDVVLDGSVWAPRKVLARLIDAGGGQRPSTRTDRREDVAEKMTPRERQVLELLKDGKSNREIAISMGIDETTVKAHLGRMLRKAGVTNRVELTLRAMDVPE